ncbi:transcriptional regulator NrdR [Candidatus Woesearchaeota archaeon]|nr:transcriptional regulator NrdR [Candidatus Woesearchaeota archaeon]
MKCPYCSNEETKVVDKRETESLSVTRRRRECLKCGKRFTTYEKVEELEIVIVKKDGRRERFDRHKLLTGLVKACEKRPVSMEKIEKVVEEIEADLRERGESEVPSKKIGEIVMRKLKSLDKVAYIRFASVYREFEDIERFEEELDKLQKK